MKFIFQTERYLHPENTAELNFWAAKWGITKRQLNEAIVDTGSTNLKQLKDHLKRNHVFRFSIFTWMRSFTGKINSVRYPG